ncbi:MAG: DUF3696 domain-containing protein [Lachnospiraceae bacterium]|nr:DUF3696 domain-containing protein [Lachnospiraceae bacterium]
MIQSLRLNNFKCFQEETISFRDLTILAGANASGKSSVIQALLLLKYSNRQVNSLGPLWNQGTVDINQVFGFPVGAPKALVTQNPTEEKAFDFAFTLQEGKKSFTYHYQIDKSSPLDLKITRADVFEDRNFQYLNAERIGPRVSHQAGQKNGITMNGENAVYLMDIADKTGLKIPPMLMSGDDRSLKFSYFVEQWMSAIMGELRLDYHTDYTKAITELTLTNPLVDTGVVPTLTGFGISYVLPVVVAGLWSSTAPQSILILENPEAHLHPYAQSNLGKFLALLACSGVQVIAETHSEHIVDGARLQMAYMSSAEQMLVNFMQQEDSKIKTTPLTVSPSGELSMWPKGFFDQKQQDLRDLIMLRSKNVHS